jgi:ribose transport system substrate-binding protein
MLCSLGVLLAIFPGCRRERPTVAVIPRTCGTWLWEPEHTGAMREAPRHGLYVYWNAPMRQDDVQGQIELIESAAERKMVGVIVSPIEDLPLRTPLNRLIESGTPVVVVGTDLGLAPQKHLAYVLNDEAAAGQLAARHIGKLLHGKGRVAILGIDKKLSSSAERAGSIENTLTSEFPGIDVMFRSLALPTVSQEQQIAEQMLAKGAHPDAIIALSEYSTRGAFFALIESNMVRTIHLVGFDQNELAPVRTGEIDAVIIQDTNEMGRVAMNLIDQEIHGNPSRSRVIVRPEIVTAETIDSPRVRESLNLDWWYRP